MEKHDMLLYENAVKSMGFTHVCGVDEAGRGPLAGDVCAAAVILPEGTVIEGLDDSKKLSPKRRESLFHEIKDCALSYAIGWASVEEIERINIRNAAYLAMKRAVMQLKPAPGYILVDGDGFYDCEIPYKCIIKGDSLSASVAAASILAKVARDEYMLKMAEKYPAYAFEKHKGYGTKLHKELILENGPCEIHRKLFLRKIQKA